jgi:hypothetical protein
MVSTANFFTMQGTSTGGTTAGTFTHYDHANMTYVSANSTGIISCIPAESHNPRTAEKYRGMRALELEEHLRYLNSELSLHKPRYKVENVLSFKEQLQKETDSWLKGALK